MSSTLVWDDELEIIFKIEGDGMKEEDIWLAASVSQKLVKTTLFVSSPAGFSK